MKVWRFLLLAFRSPVDAASFREGAHIYAARLFWVAGPPLLLFALLAALVILLGAAS